MNQIIEQISHIGIVPVIAIDEAEKAVPLARALVAGGLPAAEVTFRTAAGEEAIRRIATEVPEMLVGAGTVVTDEQLQMAIEAGAKYIITPNTNPELIRKVKAAGLCSFPGALTPTEIEIAYRAGADAVKVFPAGNLGPSYIKAVKAPLSHIPLMAVGGVNEKNTADFLKAGCCGVGVGGNLVNMNWVKAGEWDKITDLAKEYRKAVEEQ